MRKIANIISNVELTNHTKLDWINYVSLTVDANLTLPTLIIGWNRYKREFSHLYPDILVKKSNSQYPLFWEFSIDEKITDHFTGIENFVKNAPREFVNQFSYKSIDPISDNIETPEQLLSLMPVEGTYYQYKEEIIYVFDQSKNTITGIYLTAYKYFGFDVKKILSLFSEKYATKTIDRDTAIYQSYYREFPDFDQLKRSMVLFLM
jgi:hypothetical protein